MWAPMSFDWISFTFARITYISSTRNFYSALRQLCALNVRRSQVTFPIGLYKSSLWISSDCILEIQRLKGSLSEIFWISIILPVVLHGRETWYITLRVFENKILRRIFGPNRDKNEEWRWLHSAELHGLYRSLNIVRGIKSRRLRWAGHLARMQEDGN